jgi:pimeloyl-ACP methyl ester carboxylesterase
VILIEVGDGRRLEVVVAGPRDGLPLVFHYGTPGAPVPYPPMVEAATQRGLRTVLYARPGYRTSTPQPGRSVADAAADTAAILDALGADTFVTVGWSGGGPHALACAALLPDRCRAAASVAGVAPFGAPDLDWLDGMGADNVDEFGAAVAGAQPLERYLSEPAGMLGGITPAHVALAMGDLLSIVDREWLNGPLAPFMARSLRESVSTGIAGWRDDDLAFVRDWGFPLGAGPVPVAIWQGGQDRMVPYPHGRWLAANLPGATAHLLPDEGHLSLVAGRFEEILDNLID